MNQQQLKEFKECYLERNYDVCFSLDTKNKNYLFYNDAMMADVPERIDFIEEIKKQMKTNGNFEISQIKKQMPISEKSASEKSATVGSFLIEMLNFSGNPEVQRSDKNENNNTGESEYSAMRKTIESINSMPERKYLTSSETEKHIIKQALSSNHANELRILNGLKQKTEIENELLKFFKNKRTPIYLCKLILSTYHDIMFSNPDDHHFDRLLAEFFIELTDCISFSKNALSYLYDKEKRNAKKLLCEAIVNGDFNKDKHQVMLKTFAYTRGIEPRFKTVYAVRSITSACLFDLITLLDEDNKHIVKRCPECGGFFIPVKDSKQMCCDRISPFDETKTCREYHNSISNQNKNKEDKIKNEIRALKNNLAARFRSRKNKEDLEKFKNDLQEWIENVKSGEKTDQEMLDWLKMLEEEARIYKKEK